MTTTNPTAAAIARAADRRAAERATLKFELPSRPADRSRNGTRTPRSVKHKGLR